MGKKIEPRVLGAGKKFPEKTAKVRKKVVKGRLKCEDKIWLLERKKEEKERREKGVLSFES